MKLRSHQIQHCGENAAIPIHFHPVWSSLLWQSLCLCWRQAQLFWFAAVRVTPRLPTHFILIVWDSLCHTVGAQPCWISTQCLIWCVYQNLVSWNCLYKKRGYVTIRLWLLRDVPNTQTELIVGKVTVSPSQLNVVEEPGKMLSMKKYIDLNKIHDLLVNMLSSVSKTIF